MNKIFYIFIIFFSLSNHAASLEQQKPAVKHEIHIFIPGLQYRYENDPDQSIKNRRYDNYNLAGLIFQKYLVGLEFNEFEQTTSSGTLSLHAKFQEYNLYIGYNIYSTLLYEPYHIYVDLNPVAYIGQNRATVETKLNSISQQSIGENNLTLGVGLQSSLRIGFMIIQPEIRYMTSRSYEPTYVPVYGVRIGFRIGL